MKIRATLLFLAVALQSSNAMAQAASQIANPLDSASTRQPREYAVLIQGGNGITDNRDGFRFLSAGVHAGRVLTNNYGSGLLRGNFEYAVELFPYWQSFTPRFPRVTCAQQANSAVINCSQPYTVGGTFNGASITPIILRWNFAPHGRFTPWLQGAGGVLWTNHKYPSYGDTTVNLTTNGPERRRQRLELHSAGRRRDALLHASESLA